MLHLSRGIFYICVLATCAGFSALAASDKPAAEKRAKKLGGVSVINDTGKKEKSSASGDVARARAKLAEDPQQKDLVKVLKEVDLDATADARERANPKSRPREDKSKEDTSKGE